MKPVADCGRLSIRHGQGDDCIEFAYFEGKLHFNPEDSSYRFP
jgi:hypothetical protein